MTSPSAFPVSEPARALSPPDELAAITSYLGDPRGALVLDVGCVDPRVAGVVVPRGGRYLGLAAEKSAGDAVSASAGSVAAEVRGVDPDDWSGHDVGKVDVAVSVGVPLYVRNLARLLETLHHHIVSGGRLVLAVDHPFRTAGSGLSGYLLEGERPEYPRWVGRVARHRTFETYLRELRYCGFQLVELVEVGPESGPRSVVFRCVRTP